MRYQDVELHNVWKIVEDDGEPGFKTLRIPKPVWENVNKNAQNNAWHSAGCEIRGMLKDDGEAKVILQVLGDNSTPPVVGVYHGCFCAQTIAIGEDPTEVLIKPPANADLLDRITKERDLPFDWRLVRVQLPNIHAVRILSIEGNLSYPKPGSTPAKTLLSYGSSITHGACAIAPTGTYPAQCARRLGYDHINLGFGGAAHMEKVMAEHIASRADWNVGTFEMGINVRTWPLEKFRATVKIFVETIVSARPDTHLFFIDLYTNNCDFMDTPTAGVGFREAVQDIVGKYDDTYVHHVDGRSILTDPTGLRTDLVHPADDGMIEMGANLAAVIGDTCHVSYDNR